jgi:hypothetical protein
MHTCLYPNNCQFIAKHKDGATDVLHTSTHTECVDRICEICEAEREGVGIARQKPLRWCQNRQYRCILPVL